MMNKQELDDRIKALNRELRKKWFLIALFPAIVLFSAFSLTILKLPVWPLLVMLLISPFAMSVLITYIMKGASIKSNLVCPYCGEALGGYIKYLKKNGKCPSCSKSLIQSDIPLTQTHKSGVNQQMSLATMKNTGFTPLNTVMWIIGAICAGVGVARFKPHLGDIIVKSVPILENKSIAWALIAIGLTLLTVSLFRRIKIMKQIQASRNVSNE